ncbi:hypothetical protein MDA_GLEAN10010767 [Myotis davidii]|uniref:Uncharacterized protein n=1 Tax=Myotis davidii TaxID=225400 RepID=L5MF20_MYODS|nr:hypothetical protein MDA_GLEAN10010767 [Myotis davidii]
MEIQTDSRFGKAERAEEEAETTCSVTGIPKSTEPPKRAPPPPPHVLERPLRERPGGKAAENGGHEGDARARTLRIGGCRGRSEAGGRLGRAERRRFAAGLRRSRDPPGGQGSGHFRTLGTQGISWKRRA